MQNDKKHGRSAVARTHVSRVNQVTLNSKFSPTTVPESRTGDDAVASDRSRHNRVLERSSRYLPPPDGILGRFNTLGLSWQVLIRIEKRLSCGRSQVTNESIDTKKGFEGW